MFLFSLVFTILIIALCDAAHPNQQVENIGFRTSVHGVSPTDGEVVLTLFLWDAIYQCILYPMVLNTEYSCNKEEITMIGMNCDAVSPQIFHQILIDNSGTADGVVIDQIYFETSSNVLYSAENFCYDQNLATGKWIDLNVLIGTNECSDSGYDRYSALCVDNEPASLGDFSCGPGKQLLIFAPDDTFVKDGTNVQIDRESNGCNQPCQENSECQESMKCCPAKHFCNSGPTEGPTPSPTACSLVNGEFCGYTLFVKGYNIFSTKTSGNAIIDIDYIQENTESWTDEGSTCSLSSLQFKTSFSSYSQYAEYDTQSIGAAFSTSQYGAGGSLSTIRRQTKHYSSSSQTYIYGLDLKCVTAVASVVAYNEIRWNSNFVNDLRILPTSFSYTILSSNDIDSLEPYIDFWNKFGTHFMSTAELGGSIRGAITIDKCNVDQMYGNSRSYQTCLNAMYKGVAVGGCYEEGSLYSSGYAAQNVVINTQITVNGGDTSEFTNVFNQFGSKENDFEAWISQLDEFPDVIGGNLDEIHDVVRQAVKLGNHKLNSQLSAENYVDDNTWIGIADSMENAYDAYSQYLKDNDATFTDTQCTLDCQEGAVETLSCSCDQCSDDIKCCIVTKIADSVSVNANKVHTVVSIFCVIWTFVF